MTLDIHMWSYLVVITERLRKGARFEKHPKIVVHLRVLLFFTLFWRGERL
jgi:hypothetical protein